MRSMGGFAWPGCRLPENKGQRTNEAQLGVSLRLALPTWGAALTPSPGRVGGNLGDAGQDPTSSLTPPNLRNINNSSRSRLVFSPFSSQLHCVHDKHDNTPAAMGIWQNALVKMGVSQPGPKITAQDRAILECVSSRAGYKQRRGAMGISR